MRIPKVIKVGPKKFDVEVLLSVAGRTGLLQYHNRLYVSRTSADGRRWRTPYKMAETFWHEVTHAILDDMGESTLSSNERFVTRFAQRLNRMVHTARM